MLCRNALIVLIPLLIKTAAAFDINKYLTEETFPKCCPYGQNLIKADGVLQCAALKDVDSPYEYNPPAFINLNGNCTEECVDVYVEGSQSFLGYPRDNCTEISSLPGNSSYPKCCPSSYSYNSITHACKPFANKFPKMYGLVVEIGLENCVYKDNENPGTISDHLQEPEDVKISADLSITLSNKVRYKKGEYCFDTDVSTGRDLVRTCGRFKDTCMKKLGDGKPRCIWKCCKDGYVYVNNVCTRKYGFGLDLRNVSYVRNSNERFDIVHGVNGSRYQYDGEFQFFVEPDGALSLVIKSDWARLAPGTPGYCVESYHSGDSSGQTFFILTDISPSVYSWQTALRVVLLSLSCVCLALTAACYALLPEMHNLFGKLVMALCLVEFCSFAVLAGVLHNYNVFDPVSCTFVAFCITFLFLGNFSWHNVICFDMWLAFGKFRVKSIVDKKNEWKRFFYYNLYGWGVPIVLTLITFFAYKIDYLPDKYKPHVANKTCFFDGRTGTYDHLIFFMLPVFVMLMVNLILFTMTVRYCFKVKDEINMMANTPGSDKMRRSKNLQMHKEKMCMLLKLFLVMGINWLFEVLSTLVDFHQYKVTTIILIAGDSFNSLQGLNIFLIFVCKRKVFASLGRRLGFEKQRKESEVSTTMTNLEEQHNNGAIKT